MAPHRPSLGPTSGLTLIELSFVIAIVGILAVTAIPGYRAYQDRARGAHVIVQMKTIETQLGDFIANAGRTPTSLAEAGIAGVQDPWGNPYQYVDHASQPPGKRRKDKFLVPINSRYDLWSMGPDGKTAPPLTSKNSRDDIIRANDGTFYGRASAY